MQTATITTTPAAEPMRSILSVKSAAFRKALQAVRPCISKQETRYYLNGVFLQVYSERIVLTATDGHRLASAEINGDDVHVGQGGSWIIPADTVAKLVKGTRAAVGHVIIETDDTRMRFTWREYAAPISFVSPLVAGQYPDWQRVLPYRSPQRDRLVFMFNAREMVRALDTLADMGRGFDWTGAVRFERRDCEVIATLSAHRYTFKEKARPIMRGKNAGTMKVTREIDAIEPFALPTLLPGAKIGGGSSPFGFNPAYLRDFMKGVRGPVTMWTDARSSGSAWAIEAADGVTRVLMPVRV